MCSVRVGVFDMRDFFRSSSALTSQLPWCDGLYRPVNTQLKAWLPCLPITAFQTQLMLTHVANLHSLVAKRFWIYAASTWGWAALKATSAFPAFSARPIHGSLHTSCMCMCRHPPTGPARASGAWPASHPSGDSRMTTATSCTKNNSPRKPYFFAGLLVAAFLKPSTQLMAQKSEASAGWHMYS